MVDKKKYITRDGIIHIKSTMNNSMMSITNVNGDTITWSSSGSCGFKGNKKATPFATQMVAKNIFVRAKALQLKNVKIFLTGNGYHKETALKNLKRLKLNILELNDKKLIAYNGCRPPKRRKT